MKLYIQGKHGMVVHWTHYKDELQDGKGRELAKEDVEGFLTSFLEKYPTIVLYEKHWIERPPVEVDGVKYPGVYAVKAQIMNIEDFPHLVAMAEPASPS